VDKEINSLDLAAMTLEDNIRDKEAALSVDEQVVMLDGRINLTSPPPSSVGSVSPLFPYAFTLTWKFGKNRN
jgi:tektin-1